VEFFLLQVEAVIAEVRNRSSMTYSESHTGVLLTVFYPMPPVRFRSLNIFLHFDPQMMLMKLLLFLSCVNCIFNDLQLPAWTF
jgi:hypothetical protein